VQRMQGLRGLSASMSPEEQRKAAEVGMAVGPKWQDILDEAIFYYKG
jgi:hypothetical protein